MMVSSQRRASAESTAATAGATRTWVIVASLDHARRGLRDGLIMANHGKRTPLARMNRGDGIVIYSPTTT